MGNTKVGAPLMRSRKDEVLARAALHTGIMTSSSSENGFFTWVIKYSTRESDIARPCEYNRDDAVPQ